MRDANCLEWRQPDDGPRVGGTLVWYYHVCQRQVWLMGHALNPDEDDPNVDLGRFIHEHSFRKERKELQIEGAKFDFIRSGGAGVVIVEVKKSSRSLESARLQLAFYLREMRMRGVEASGEIRVPSERKRERVVLTKDLEERLERIIRDILRILYLEAPPAAKRGASCRPCAYREFCWS